VEDSLAEEQEATVHQRGVWEQLIAHWEREDTAETSSRNSRNRKSDRGGKGMYVHNLGACSMSTKEDELVSFLLLFIFIFFK